MNSTMQPMPASICFRRKPKHRAFHGLALCDIFLLLILWLPLSMAMAQTSAASSNAVTSPERVKAVYLYKFLNYVEWPASSFETNDSPYVIGIMDANEVANELTKLSAASNIGHRAMTVKRLKPGDPLNGVHVLFIGQSERRLPQVVTQLQSQPVLLVTESDGALSEGSMINFRIVDDRVRFEVALDAVEKSGLKLNTRLLSVAINVVKGAP